MLKKMFKNYYFVWSIVGIMLLIICIGVGTYAFFNYSRTGGENVIGTGVITFNYSDDTLIDISNDFPQDDYSLMSTADYNALKSSHGGSLNITAHSNITDGITYSIYVIYGDEETGRTRLLDENVKFLFTPNFSNGNGFTSLTNNYATPAALNFDSNGRALIATGLVKDTVSSTTVGYNFSMWLDSTTMHVSSTTKRTTLAEGNPSLADSTTGTTTAGRYLKNDTTLTTTTLYPARSEAQGKTIYTTKEFSTGYYSIKFLVEATEYISPICMRVTNASDLHTETCSQTSDYCAADGYTGANTTITYGNAKPLGTNTLTVGDAFDCDVNGNGQIDVDGNNKSTERFYYVSPRWTPGTDTSASSFDTNTAVLIYYSNTYNGAISNTGAAYATKADAQAAGSTSTDTYQNWWGPVTAVKHLPKIKANDGTWDDFIIKDNNNESKRAIIACNDGNCTTASTSTSGGSLPQGFSYTGYAGRLLTIPEIKKAGCDTLSDNNITSLGTTGALKACNFLMERTKYTNSALATYGPWLENAYASYSSYAWNVTSSYRSVNSSTVINTSLGARPAIEVPIDRISK